MAQRTGTSKTTTGSSSQRQPPSKKARAGKSQETTSKGHVQKQGEEDDEFSGVKGDLKKQDDPPDDKTWNKLQILERLDWSTSEADAIQYQPGQDVVIVPNSRDISHKKKGARAELKWEDLWYGHILEIRAGPEDDDGNQDAWVKIAWYYSPKWFMTVKAKEARLRDFGKYEQIYAPPHIDIVHPDTLNGIENIYHFDEENYDSEDIPSNVFYNRCTYDTTARKWLTPPPRRHCLCNESFKLNDPESPVMHYCPGSKCHKWYHVDCLEDKGFSKTKTFSASHEEHFQYKFDENKFVDLVNEIDRLPRQPGSYTGGIDGISRIVVAYARQPIVRGGKHRAFGNMAAVLRARRILQQAVRRGVMPPDDYENYVKYRPEAPESDDESDDGNTTTTAVDEDESGVGSVRARAGGKRKRADGKDLVPRVSGERFVWPRVGQEFTALICPSCQKYI